MDKKTTHLSRQLKTIVIFAILAAVLFVVYFAVLIFDREELNVVYKTDSDGDEVMAVITDMGKKDRGINITYIENVLAGKANNNYNVKMGSKDNVLYTFEADDVKITYYPMIFPEVSLDEVDYITVTNSYGYFKVYMDPLNATAVIEQAKMNLYNQNQLSTLLLQSRFMLASSKLQNPSKNLADYGLAPSQNPIQIEICDKNGKTNTVYMGTKVPGGGYYMKHKDKEHIYIMDETCSIFENDVKYYLNPVITRPIPSDYSPYISYFSCHKNGNELFTCEIIPEEERVGTFKNQLHRIVSPENKKQDILSTVTLYETFSLLSNLSGIYVMEYEVSQKQDYDAVMERYGFANPSFTVEYLFGESAYYASFGNSFTDSQTGEKFYYVYSPYMDTVVLMSASSAPFLEYEYIDFVNNKIFQHNIDDVAKITLTNNHGSRVFVTSGTGNELCVTEQNTGKDIHVASFRQFYIALVSAGVDGYSEIEKGVDVDTLEHNLTFEIELKSGDVLKYAFYSESTLRCYAVINGVGEFYTKREYVDRIASLADKLMSGEIIESNT